jgi:quercetin dioxygenase-like cupin family protein
MVMRLDRDLLRGGGGAGGRGRGGAPGAAATATAVTRRALGPTVFSTTWAYMDHVLVPPGASTSELAHASVGEAYYVLAGNGTVTVKGAASETAPVVTGDAIPIRIGETSLFTNTGAEPLELFIMGVAKDMAAKTQLLTAAGGRG